MKMKLSRWNSYIRLGEKAGLVFNALTDSFVAVKEGCDDFVHASEGNIALFSDDFRQQMEQAGALVDSEKDEPAEVADLIREIDNDESTLQVIVNPTLDCNFHCWYCYENHLKASCMTSDVRSAIAEYVRRHIASVTAMERLYLSFFGGEPLLRFDEVVKPLVEEVAELCQSEDKKFYLHFTTNGYLLNDDMISFLSRHKASFQITLDGGRENHDNTRFGKGKTPSFDSILGNILKLAQNECFVTLRINYTTQVIDSTAEIIEIISRWPQEVRTYVNVDYQRVWQDTPTGVQDATYATARRLRRELNKAGYSTANNRIIDHVRRSCYGDKRHELLVNFNGDVFACTARDFKTDSRLGYLGHDGKVVWDGNRYEQRMDSRFQKEVCHECRIAPLCGGGCRTKCTEHSNHGQCNLGLTAESIDEMILERFEERFIQH